MALRLRRGTDAQRQLITPVEGELIYVTDTKELYAGDGTTLGGIRISGEVVDTLNQLDDVDAALPQDGDVLIYDSATGDWVAGELPLVDLPDVNAAGILDGQVLAWDTTTSSFIPANNVGGGGSIVGDLVGSVFADDSTSIIDAQNRILNIDDVFVLNTIDAQTVTSDLIGDVTGDVTGNLTGNVTGNLTGDVIGSIFSDDSTLMLDAINQIILTNFVKFTDSLDLESSLSSGSVVNVNSLDETSDFRLLRTSNTDISSDAVQYGRFLFGRQDINGTVETASLSGYQDGFALSHDTNGIHTSPSLNMFVKDGQFAFGTFAPATNAKVDVAGNLHVTSGYTQFGSLTSTERDALTAANGMVIYNETNNKFEGYQNGAWINLDDGTAAS